jgi:hypothetical protein
LLGFRPEPPLVAVEVMHLSYVSESSLHHFPADFALPILLGIVRSFLLEGLTSVAVTTVSVIPVAGFAQIAIVLVLLEVPQDLTPTGPAPSASVLRGIDLRYSSIRLVK